MKIFRYIASDHFEPKTKSVQDTSQNLFERSKVKRKTTERRNDKLLTQAHAATKALEGISDGGNNIKASLEVYNKNLVKKN